MGDLTHGVTFDLVSRAMDAAALRHKVLAGNIANANTAGYRPATVEFESRLEAARRQLAAGGSVTSDVLGNAAPKVVTQDRDARTGVGSLDLQAARMAENTLHYEALARALTRHVSILGVAINEGRK